jgi:hypothetical protein
MLSHNVLATEFMITFPKVSKVNQNNVWRMVTAVICLANYYGFFHLCNLFGLCHFHLCHAKLVIKKRWYSYVLQYRCQCYHKDTMIKRLPIAISEFQFVIWYQRSGVDIALLLLLYHVKTVKWNKRPSHILMINELSFFFFWIQCTSQ